MDEQFEKWIMDRAFVKNRENKSADRATEIATVVFVLLVCLILF